ncbi:MAG: hypothetical protein IH936_13540 [Acidobacteria bacterium]|nr:hypothetical protein [Acidobacteriota bacterium]
MPRPSLEGKAVLYRFELQVSGRFECPEPCQDYGRGNGGEDSPGIVHLD